MGSLAIPSVDGAGWLDGWDYRQGIAISGSLGAGPNYQVFLNVQYYSDMQVDFDDLRFTDDDGSTLLDYWREEWIDSSYAKIWVEVADNLDNDQTIYMYYGNDAVSTISNGENTFPFYEDWTIESMNPARWDLINNDGSISFDDTFADFGSILKLEGSDGANEQSYESVYDVIAPTSIMFRANIEQTLVVNQRIRIGSGSPIIFSFAYIEGNAATNQLSVYDDDGNPDHQAIDAEHFGAYHKFEITRDGTFAKLYIDGVLDVTASCEPDIISTPATYMGVVDSEKDLYVDWFAVRNWIASEPVATWGVWHIIGDAEFIFPIGWDPIAQFGYDAFFIVLGLIMIPVSTMYLVRGGRKGMSRDKLFYGLIIFVMGLGLLIGGVMP